MVKEQDFGHDGPKGTYILDIKPKPKYLFEIIIDTLKRANKKYETTIPWYIMTSDENNEETIKFFENNNYFEYPKESVMFIIQGKLPIINKEGKLLLDENNMIKEASDGNGSTYRTLYKSGALTDMEKRGVEWVYICAVDNPLLQILEPLLVGATISQKNLAASKSIVKCDPFEKVGAFCKKNGKPSVIEYTELPKEEAIKTDKDGELIYGEAHIMCNLFNIEAIKKICTNKLPYHVAFKKIDYYENGKLIKPSKPNAYKFEAYIFDGFSLFENITIVRGKREESFAPTKNSTGVDSAQTAIELYNNYWFGKHI